MKTPRAQDRATTGLALAGAAAAATSGVVAVALAAFVVWRSAFLLGLLFLACVVAVLLDRPVAALVRRGHGRGTSLALVLVGAAIAAVAAVVLAFGPLFAQLSGLAAAAPGLADQLRGILAGRAGRLLEGTPLATWFQGELSRSAAAVAEALYGAAGGVANAAGTVATALVVAVLLLANGPRLVTRAVDAFPPRRRPWARALARDLSSSLSGYLAGLSAIVAARVAGTATFLAVAKFPFAIPLALLAGGSVLIPYLGSVLRLVAIGAVVWATRGSGAALAALTFVAVYDLFENYVISPLVYRRTMGVSALNQLLAVLFFGYHFGVAGAVLAIPLAATAQIVARALRARGPDAAPDATTAPAATAARPEGRIQGASPRAHRPPSHEAPAGGHTGE